MYAYVGNNPVNRRDPSGLTAEPTMIDGPPNPTPCLESNYWGSYESCLIFYKDDFGARFAHEMCSDMCFGGSGGGLSCRHKVGLLCAGSSGLGCWAVAAAAGITTGIRGAALAVICGMIMYGGCTYAQNQICG